MNHHAAFVIPARVEKREMTIYLAQRNTPPHQGLFGAIGGKIDPRKEGEEGILPYHDSSFHLVHFEKAA